MRREGKAHIFKDRATMEFVVEAIRERGEIIGLEDKDDDYDRYGLYFDETIGYQLRADGSMMPLYYAEIKIVKGGNTYHVIPRTKPRRSE